MDEILTVIGEMLDNLSCVSVVPMPMFAFWLKCQRRRIYTKNRRPYVPVARLVKHKKLRDSFSPVRTGEAGAVADMERLSSPPTASAIVAGPAGEPAIEGAAPAKTSSGDRLLDAWGESSEEERTAFLTAIGEDIDLSQQGTLRRAHYEGTEKALKDIRKRYEKRRLKIATASMNKAN